MSLIINAISAIGNNTSFYPLLVRDCGIEAPVKVYQTNRQNAKESSVMAKHATRERIIDEYGASAIWLGGIPLVEKICNKIIDKKGISSKINYKLLDDNISAMSDIDKKQQGIDININKFKNIKGAEEAVKDLEKAKANKGLLKKLTVGKYTAAIAIPVALMGFVLPKANFALTNVLFKRDAKKGLIPEKYLKDKKGLNLDIISEAEVKAEYNNLFANNKTKDVRFEALNSIKKKGNPSFTGFASFMTGLTQQQKMAITDGGLGLGRVGTSRRKNEGIENAFRMAGMMYLNFVAPKQIDKGLDKVIKGTFGINPSLDPMIMANKRFLAKVRSNKLELPKKQEEVLEFIDNNPKSIFAKITAQTGDVKYLKSGIRDPRCYVDTEKVFNLAQKMDRFGQDARKSGDVVKYAKKALGAKSANIFTNILISSSLLAFALPQAQFALRKALFGSDVDPGLA